MIISPPNIAIVIAFFLFCDYLYVSLMYFTIKENIYYLIFF